jgi:hypothetical protein
MKKWLIAWIVLPWMSQRRGNIMRAIIASAIIAALFTPAHSEEGTAAMGVGTRTCALFAQDYKRDPKMAELIYGAWAQGFIAGLNLAQEPARNAAAVTVKDQASIFRIACDRRPLALFMEIVMIHYWSLPEYKD